MATQGYLDFDSGTIGASIDFGRSKATRDDSAREQLSGPRRNRRLLEVLSALASQGIHGRGMTRSEVARVIGCKDTGVCQAFADCMHPDERLVETTGERRMGDGGKSVDVYRLTGRGHRVLIESHLPEPRHGPLLRKIGQSE